MDGEPDHHMQGVEGVLKPHFCQYGDSMTSFFECEIKTRELTFGWEIHLPLVPGGTGSRLGHLPFFFGGFYRVGCVLCPQMVASNTGFKCGLICSGAN